MSETRIGFSGWTYAPWRGIFYPAKLKHKEELAYAAARVTSIEINGTFYRLQKPATFQSWYDQTPSDFKFSVKATQFITHRRRLMDVEQPLANFFASGILALKEKLGPILWQFPPNLPLVDERFEEFIKQLPQTGREAGELAKNHDAFVRGRALTDPGGDYPIRHAFEFRHSSFRDDDFFDVMREHNVAVVMADAGEHGLAVDRPTADFVYVRMHGQDEAYVDGYTEAALQETAAKIRTWQVDPSLPGGVFIYFDNDAKAHAPKNAMRLLELLA